MEHSAERDSKHIVFDLAPAVCFKQLVNNAFQADIRFKVDEYGELIYAHRLLITMASEVFNTQFCGWFAESQRDTLTDPVVIEDIEPGPFLEVMRFIYCGEVNIQSDNLLDIYYSSEKYMLRNLGKVCEDNFKQHINETTVLKVFQHNRRYKFFEVDTLCLEMICDNPLHYFKQEEFLSLNQQAIELIAASPAMNCSFNAMNQAVRQWEERNVKTKIKVQLKKMLCRKLYLYAYCAYSSSIDTHFALNVGNNGSIALYGLGVFVGVENDSPIPNTTVNVTVELLGFSVQRTFKVKDELEIYNVMFERQLIDKECKISVKVVQQDSANQYKMFHLTGFSTMDKHAKLLTVTGYDASSNQLHKQCSSYCKSCNIALSHSLSPIINCVAYLLCSKK